VVIHPSLFVGGGSEEGKKVNAFPPSSLPHFLSSPLLRRGDMLLPRISDIRDNV
jgi:hypothetical protein